MPTLDQHSRTAAYGMLSRLERFREIRYSRQMEAILDAIRRGSFAQEWSAEFSDGYPRLQGLRRQIEESVMHRQEQRVLQRLTSHEQPAP